MTPTARRDRTAASRPGWGLGRASLAGKLSVAFLGLVAFVLIVNGGLDSYLTYGQAKRAALEVEAEKARAAAERVGVFLDEIQTQLGWTAGVEWGYAKPEQQRYDFIRLLRQAPAITALSFIDGKGREQLAVSRLEPDAVASGKDFSADPRFLRAVADKIWFGPVEFRRGSEPYVTVALAHVGKSPGVTVADVNLKLVWDVVSAIRVGDKGFAYVVDDHGRLIAHPDLSLVLRDTDYSHLPQVAAALAGRGASEAEVARSTDGAGVLTAHAVAPKTRWIVFVEQPLAEALATAYRSLARSLALLGLGLALAAVSGVALARKMAAPIRLLQAGAEKLGAGDLAQRLDIRTGDEIEALAGGFNRMAGQLQESYENLEGKVEARTRDLNEALSRQTATSEILRAIAASPGVVQPVLEQLVRTVCSLCDASDAVIMLRDGDDLWTPAHHGPIPTPPNAGRRPISRDWPPGRAVADGAIVHVHDLAQARDEYPLAIAISAGVARDAPQHASSAALAWRTALAAPLMREGAALGAIVLRRVEAAPFSEGQIALLQTFADQAVIAVENARLFAEVQDKTRDLEESLAQQTATAEVLKVISRSAFDLQVVFETLLTTALDLVGGVGGGIALREGERLRFRAGASPKGDLAQGFVGRLIEIDLRSAAGRAVLSGRTEYIPDAAADPEFHPVSSRNWGASYLGVPLSREGRTVGAITIIAERSHAFTPRHIELVETFADQAVIAIGNTRLLEEVQSRTRELEQSLSDLRKAQDRLVQSEKLASLGQLTAGIAHEIKNPLNFVNNFASLSRELLEELREPLQRLPDDARAEADDLMAMIDSNLEKVATHGRRADSIVKNMLLHSRQGSGTRSRVNINAMVEEALNLGYHGARAEKPSFNVALEKHFDPDAGEADIYLQEVTRVLLNLIANGFYASAQRKLREGADYTPTLKASTRDLGHSVEIRIRDNGAGIPDEVKAKMFDPFFTTKPAGEGTGLGLSLSHDIIVKQHGGALDVETEPGAFTEFVITLPRTEAGA